MLPGVTRDGTEQRWIKYLLWNKMSVSGSRSSELVKEAKK